MRNTLAAQTHGNDRPSNMKSRAECVLFRTSAGMHRMQMYREIMAVPPLTALVICQFEAVTPLANHGDVYWNRWVMSLLRNASHYVCGALAALHFLFLIADGSCLFIMPVA